jgi:NAD-dependent dihydropyrimidine dehydrogenase PreA subunit
VERRYPVYTESADCQDCYQCIRRCPVKAIKVESGHARVVPDMCIVCGRCVVNCPGFAKRARNDTGAVRRLLRQLPPRKVFVSLAPSAFAEFGEFSPAQLEKALLSLGFFAGTGTPAPSVRIYAMSMPSLLTPSIA